MPNFEQCERLDEVDLDWLKDAVDRACAVAYDHRHEIASAVNWADLGCISVEVYMTDSGEKGYRAYISEASPECDAFKKFINEFLVGLDIAADNVEIITEW
ncbi:MAG TPA: hypothetical protein VIH69_05030 [Dehalococcoidia bacterium]